MCAPSLVCALTWHVRAVTWHVLALTCARPNLACARPLRRPSPKCNVGVQLPPLSVRIVVFLPSATLWDGWVHPHLACARPHLACAGPHLARARPLRRPSPKSNVGVQLPPLSVRIVVFLPSATMWDSSKCAPRLGKCEPRIGKCAPTWQVGAETWQVRAETWHVRAQTWQVHALTWHVRALSAAPLQKAMSVSNYPPYPCVLMSFCLPLPCGIVASARPDLASAR
jgi:hypothetical protein